MAPVQGENSICIQKSAGFMMPSICHCGSSFVNDLGWWLPVSRRGHFFQDSFFENARRHFDAAVKEALSKWGEMEKFSEAWNSSSSSLFDNLSRYRQLKTSNRLEENLATTFVSDNDTHKIVMDLHDFKDGDIKVRVLGEKEVFVEGKGNGLSSSQAFSRRFIYPESVDMAAVTSVLSSDGILTIEAPVLSSRVEGNSASFTNSRKTVDDAIMHGCQSLSKSLANSQFTSLRKEDANKVFYCKCCNKRIGPWMNERETSMATQEGMRIPIKIDGSLTQQHLPSTSTVSHNASDKLSANSKVKEIKIETEKEHTQANEMVNRQICEAKILGDSSGVGTVPTSRTGAQSALQNTFNVPIASCFNSFPIIRRGLFFSDSIFEDMRKDFELAVQEVLSKWGDKSSVMDNLTHYRNLRSLDLREENQAAKVIDSATSHKVVLDVQDFVNGGDITIKAMNDRELIIEGQIHKGNEGSQSLKKFSKRFVFPRDIQLNAVTSVMSSDGVLTVTAPIKSSSVQLREFIIPMSIEEVKDNNSEKKDAKHTISEALEEKVKQNTCAIHEDSSASSNKKESLCTTALNIQPICTKPSSHVESVASLDKQESKASREHIIPVTVEGQRSISTANSFGEVQSQRELHKNQPSTSHIQEEKHSQEKKISEINTSSKINSNALINQTTAATHDQTCSSQRLTEGASALVAEENSNYLQRGKGFVSLPGSKFIPITRHGLFFNDSFFNDYRNDFQTAVTEVLMKFRENISESELMNTYRNLRMRDLKVENQALKVHEDQNSFMVVLDVKDFTDGDITVSIDGEELVIDGRAERTETKASDTLTFSHRFLLPEVTDLSAVTSAISSDGVLTVNSPKSGSSSEGNVRKMSSVAESKHESHHGGSHLWQTKNMKKSSEQSKGFSSSTVSSSCQSQQIHS